MDKREEDALGEILKELIRTHNRVIRRAEVVTARGMVTRGIRQGPGPLMSKTPPKSLEEPERVLLAALLFSLADILAFREDGDRVLWANLTQGSGTHWQHLLLREGDGYISLVTAGPKAVLVIFFTTNVLLGLVMPDSWIACKKIKELIPNAYTDLGVPADAAGVRDCVQQLMQRFDTT
jgi:hypothetical protein